jgi:hypothetical protein
MDQPRQGKRPLLSDALPELSSEIRRQVKLYLEQDPDSDHRRLLDEALSSLRTARVGPECNCHDPECGSFYTLPAADRPRGLNECLPLTAGLVLDIVGGKVVFVEWLARGARDKLRAALGTEREER